MSNYKEKIKKLLALAESPNEHEAKAALLKAKRLMAEYKIAEIDLVDVEKKKVKTIETEYVYTKRGEYWIGILSVIIAENYCCRSARSRVRGSQTGRIIFVGLEDDVDLCAMVFAYAVDSARELAKAYIRNISKQYVYGLSAGEKKEKMNSYALGFTKGVEEAFRIQADTPDESQWGLVMVVPKEVNEECKGFRKDNYAPRHNVDSDCRSDGYAEGKRFNPNHRLNKHAGRMARLT